MDEETDGYVEEEPGEDGTPHRNPLTDERGGEEIEEGRESEMEETFEEGEEEY